MWKNRKYVIKIKDTWLKPIETCVRGEEEKKQRRKKKKKERQENRENEQKNKQERIHYWMNIERIGSEKEKEMNNKRRKKENWSMRKIMG